MLVFVAVAGYRNSEQYPAIAAPDAEEHLGYATMLVDTWDLPTPDELRTYYTPPGYYLVAGTALEVGERVGMERPVQAAQILNVLISIAAAVLVLVLSRMLFPSRPLVHLAAVAFYAVCPVISRYVASVHPQPLAMLLGLAGVVIATRIAQRRGSVVLAAVALGVVVGAAQLVRNVGLWALGACVLALAAAALWQPERRRRLAVAAVVALVVGIAIPLPWYIHLQQEYGDPVFGRLAASELPVAVRTEAGEGLRRPASVGMPSLPVAYSWPPSFWSDPKLEGVFTHPTREDLRPALWPILYTDLWGDYFGFWAWGSTQQELTPGIERRLVAQSAAGVPLTLLAVIGGLALAFLAVARRRADLVAVASLPLIAVAGIVFYAQRAPVPDGDTVKALFLLPALPAAAVAFGFACDGVLTRYRQARIPLLVLVAVALGACAAFSLY